MQGKRQSNTCVKSVLGVLGGALILGAGALLPTAANAGIFDKDPEPLVLKADSKPAEMFANMIDDGAALRHVSKPYAGESKKVALGTVKLNFITDAGASAKTKEFMGKATVSASAQMKLVGVSPEMMTKIADQFQAQLRKRLEEQGYEVIPQDQLLALAEFRDAVAATKAVDTSLFGAVTTVYAPGTGSLDSFGMRNFSFNMKVPVVIANLTLNFAAFDKETSRWSEGNTISASISSRVVSTVSGSMRLMTEDGGGGIFEIVRPLVLPGRIVEKVEPIAKSGAEQAAGVVGALFGALTKSSASSGSYQATAAPNYEEVMSQDLGSVAGIVAHVIKKR